MKITCDSCGAKYTIADDKVRGRKVKIRCKGCGTAIVVDGQQEKASPSTPPEAGAEADTGIPVDVGAAGASSAPPPAGSDANSWSVNLSESDQRTLTTQELVDGWKSGLVTADAFVWKEGMADWIPILESAELKPLLEAPAGKAPAAARPSATPAARVSGGRSQAGADLFAAAATAGADEEEAPAPALPARPTAGKPPSPATAADDKPTGARNENSVLFSLDALKAGFSGPAPTKPEPPGRKTAAPRGASTDDLLGAPAMGGGGPMFSLADNNALLTAPAPPEPPKPKIVEAFAPGATAPEQKGSKKMIVALSALLVLVIGGGAAALMINSQNKEKELAAAAASASAAIQAAKDEEQKAKDAAEKAREEKRTEEERAKAAEEKAKEAVAKGEEKPAASADPTKPGAPGTPGKPGATTAPGTTTKKDEKKDEKTPPPAPAGGDQPFSKAAAVSALSAAAGSAGSCKKLGGPTGTGRVQVTFAPSGRVTTANVDGAPFAGTSVGGCVASLFRKAHVPAFSGNAVTVSKSFSIN